MGKCKRKKGYFLKGMNISVQKNKEIGNRLILELNLHYF